MSKQDSQNESAVWDRREALRLAIRRKEELDASHHNLRTVPLIEEAGGRPRLSWKIDDVSDLDIASKIEQAFNLARQVSGIISCIVLQGKYDVWAHEEAKLAHKACELHATLSGIAPEEIPDDYPAIRRSRSRMLDQLKRWANQWGWQFVLQGEIGLKDLERKFSCWERKFYLPLLAAGRSWGELDDSEMTSDAERSEQLANRLGIEPDASLLVAQDAKAAYWKLHRDWRETPALSDPKVAVSGDELERWNTLIGKIQSCVELLRRSALAESDAPLASARESTSAVDALPSLAEEKPDWDPQCQELRFRGVLCKKFPRKATNQFRLLAAFQRAGWPSRISNPFSKDRDDRKLGATIRDLRDSLEPESLITFERVNAQATWKRRDRR